MTKFLPAGRVDVILVGALVVALVVVVTGPAVVLVTGAVVVTDVVEELTALNPAMEGS